MDGTHARALLGLPIGASKEQIDHAFRGVVLVAHPDRGGDAAAFDRAVQARDVLRSAAPTPAPSATAATPSETAPAATRRPDPFGATFSTAAPSRVDLRDVTRRTLRPAPTPTVSQPGGDEFERLLAAHLAAA